MSMLSTPKDELGPNRHIVEVQEPTINKVILKKVDEALNKSPIEPINPRMAARGGEIGLGNNSDYRAIMERQNEDNHGPAGSPPNLGGPRSRSRQNARNVDDSDIAGLQPQGKNSPLSIDVDHGKNAAENEYSPPMGEEISPSADDVFEPCPPPEPHEAANRQNQLLQIVQMGQEHVLQVVQVDPAVDQVATTSDAKDTGKNEDIEVEKKEDEEDPVKEPEAKRGKPDDQLDLDEDQLL